MFQRNILTILAEEARYGLAIKGELEEYYRSEVNHGRLYPNLDDIVELGLVEKNSELKNKWTWLRQRGPPVSGIRAEVVLLQGRRQLHPRDRRGERF